MSFESLNDFFCDLDKKADLSEAFDRLDSGDNINAEVVALGAKFGYDFNEEELAQVIDVARKMKRAQTEQE